MFITILLIKSLNYNKQKFSTFLINTIVTLLLQSLAFDLTHDPLTLCF